MAEVAARSPAAAADIRSGDVVKVVDGRTIIGRCEFEFSLVDHKAGDVLHMELLRGGQPVEASLKLGARPKPDGAVLLREKFGLAAEPLTKAMANAALLRVDRGVRITGVASGPPYNRIKSPPLPGDILARVNDIAPATWTTSGCCWTVSRWATRSISCFSASTRRIAWPRALT